MENVKTKAEITKEYRQKNKPYHCERCFGMVHYGQVQAHNRSKKHLKAVEQNLFIIKKENEELTINGKD